MGERGQNGGRAPPATSEGSRERLEALQRWVVGFAVVGFDLEYGQTLEYLYPSGCLTETEQRNVAYSAFPDSNSGALGDHVFCFRIRDGAPPPGSKRTSTSSIVASRAIAATSSSSSSSSIRTSSTTTTTTSTSIAASNPQGDSSGPSSSSSPSLSNNGTSPPQQSSSSSNGVQSTSLSTSAPGIPHSHMAQLTSGGTPRSRSSSDSSWRPSTPGRTRGPSLSLPTHLGTPRGSGGSLSGGPLLGSPTQPIRNHIRRLSVALKKATGITPHGSKAAPTGYPYIPPNEVERVASGEAPIIVTTDSLPPLDGNTSPPASPTGAQDAKLAFAFSDTDVAAATSGPPRVPPSPKDASNASDSASTPLSTSTPKETSSLGPTPNADPPTVTAATTPTAERSSSPPSSSSSSQQQQQQQPAASSSSSSPPGAATAMVRSTGRRFLYGFAFFRQKRDESIKRGFMQKSVVILTHQPYASLFLSIVSLVGPLYFAHGIPLLETACHNIERWPDPSPRRKLELPVLGTVFPVQLNDPEGLPYQLDAIAPPTTVASPMPISVLAPEKEFMFLCDDQFQGVNLAEVFRGVAKSLWHLWELVITGQPLLIHANTPSECSQAVLGLIALITPMRYFGDYRPYFTIHDSDFLHYADASSTPPPPSKVPSPIPSRRKLSPRGMSPALGSTPKSSPIKGSMLSAGDSSGSGSSPLVLPSAMLAVTNPLFLKTLDTWPHVLTIGHAPMAAKHVPRGASKTRTPRADGWKQKLATRQKPLVSADKELLHRLSKVNDQYPLDPKKNKNPLLAQEVPEIEPGQIPTPYQLSPLPKDVAESLNHALRTHFTALTKAFMMPLERYFNTLLPLHKSIVPFVAPPVLSAFDRAAFLEDLPNHQAAKELSKICSGTTMRAWVEVYRRFVHSPNFEGWLRMRRSHALGQLRRVYRDLVYNANVAALVASRDEIGRVDLFLAVRKVHDVEARRDPVDEHMCERLREHMESVTASLPEDLQATMRGTA